MKKIYCYLLVLICSVFFSCKNDQKNENQEDIKKPKNNVSIVLNAVVLENDTFHVYYNEDGSEKFNEENSIWLEFKGKKTPQNIVFELPEDVLPSNLRIDFGINKEQKDIEIKSFKINYLGKKIEAYNSGFFKYFRINELTAKLDMQKCLVTPTAKKDNYVGPSFYPLPDLKIDLEKLYK